MDNIIAYCGMVCAECPAFIATQNDDQEALKQVAAQWSQEFDASFTPEDCICDGCLVLEGRSASYCHQCEIRACGIEKKVQNCAYCDEYTCEKLEKFFAFVPPDAKASLERVRQSL